jgi:hypothetical protein
MPHAKPSNSKPVHRVHPDELRYFGLFASMIAFASFEALALLGVASITILLGIFISWLIMAGLMDSLSHRTAEDAQRVDLSGTPHGTRKWR